jgi:hypothetical protein
MRKTAYASEVSPENRWLPAVQRLQEVNRTGLLRPVVARHNLKLPIYFRAE